MEKAALFTERLPHEEIAIEGVGVVTIRGLSRMELLLCGKHSDEGPLIMERHMLAYAMVDPALTLEEVAKWQEISAAGEIGPIVTRINVLSGISQDSAKEAYKSV